MPRNGSGTYTLPEAAFVSGTTISSTAVNSDLSDMAAAMTGSLARDGQGGMSDVLPLANSGFSYLNDPNTGMSRSASDTQVITCGGTNVVTIASTSARVAGQFSASGIISQLGSPIIPIGLGPLPWSLATAPALWALCYGQACTSTYSDYRTALIAAGSPYGNNGTDPLFPDMRDVAPVGKGNMGGSDRGLLTTANFGANPLTLGVLGGLEAELMARANLPNVQLALSGILNVISGGSQAISPKSGDVFFQSGNTGPNGYFDYTKFAALTVDLSSGSTASMNGGVTQTVVKKVQPSIITNYIVYVGV